MGSGGARLLPVDDPLLAIAHRAGFAGSDIGAAELFESVEDIVEAVVALCDCPSDITGRVFSSLDLIDEWGLSVRGLDGLARV